MPNNASLAALSKYGKRKKYPARIIDQGKAFYNTAGSLDRAKSAMDYWAKIDPSPETFRKRVGKLLRGFKFWKPQREIRL